MTKYNTKIQNKTEFKEEQMINSKQKNCKKNQNNAKNNINLRKNKEFLLDTLYKTHLNVYIKVLLEAYKSIPNIISVIDRIIEQRASTLLPSSSIYGTSYLCTIKEINKVIDLGLRKDKLLNLYVIIEKMLECLSEKDRKFVILKFVQKNTTSEIAKEMQVTERTIFRKSQKTIEEIGISMLKQNWSSEFIRMQIDNEPWLVDLFNKMKEKDFITINHRHQ